MIGIKNIALNSLLTGAMLIFACKNKITSPEETPLEVLHGQIHNVAETIRNSEGQYTYPIMLEFGQLWLSAM